jgi:hypothetical protein
MWKWIAGISAVTFGTIAALSWFTREKPSVDRTPELPPPPAPGPTPEPAPGRELIPVPDGFHEWLRLKYPEAYHSIPDELFNDAIQGFLEDLEFVDEFYTDQAEGFMISDNEGAIWEDGEWIVYVFETFFPMPTFENAS